MSDAWDNDDDTANDTPLMKDLRKQLREQKKERDELASKVAAFELTQRRSALSETIVSKGYPAKVAELVPADLEADKVEEWLGKYADLFGVTSEEPDAKVDPTDIALFNRMAASTQGGNNPPIPQKIIDQTQAVLNAATEADLLKLIHGTP